MDVFKILVLGESRTGKTTLILSILGEDLMQIFKNQSAISHISNSTPPPIGRDFVLKILNIEGKKVRI